MRKRNPFRDDLKRSKILAIKTSTSVATPTARLRFSFLLCATMSLTASEIASLSTRRTYWEYAEYISSALVALGCLGEYVADFTIWFTRSRRKAIGRVSTLLLIAALAGELVCLMRTNSLSAELLGSLDDKAQDAFDKASRAITNSGNALVQAGAATSAAGGAMKEAESFEGRIVAANNNAAGAIQKAADAESHLADAEQRAAHAESESAKAQLELARLSAPFQSVPVIKGVARPDPMTGTKQRVTLHANTVIILPKMAKGKSLDWTLLIVQDDTGNHQFGTVPKVMPGGEPDSPFGNVLFFGPHTVCTMELASDENGTIDKSFGGVSCVTPITK